jgi:hypothetical protein
VELCGRDARMVWHTTLAMYNGDLPTVDRTIEE